MLCSVTAAGEEAAGAAEDMDEDGPQYHPRDTRSRPGDLDEELADMADTLLLLHESG